MSRERLQAALDGQAGGAGVQRIRGTRPPPLDGPSLRAATTPLMAAFMVAAAMLRAKMETAPLDLMGIALRTLAFAFTVRAMFDLVRLVTRLVRDGRAPAWGLAWDDDGLLLRGPGHDSYLERSAIAAALCLPARLPGEAKTRARPVWLALWPSAERRGLLTLPPYFALDSDVLVARLGRWLGDTAEPSDPPTEGVWAIGRDEKFWTRAPFGWLLLGAGCLEVLRVSPEAVREALWLPACAMAVATLLAPLLWLGWMWHRTATPGRVLVTLDGDRITGVTKHGGVSLRYSDIASIEVHHRARWSPFSGGYAVRILELSGRDGTLLRFDSSLLDAPVEVVAWLSAKLAGIELDPS